MSDTLKVDTPGQGSLSGDAREALLPSASPIPSFTDTFPPPDDGKRILIPGRPQARQGSSSWEEWRHNVAAQAIKVLGDCSLPLQPEGFIQLHIELYYAIPEGVNVDIEALPSRWSELHIPRGSIAADSVLIALSGILCAKRGQVQPLVVSRFVKPRGKLIEQFGPDWRYGGTVLQYAV